MSSINDYYDKIAASELQRVNTTPTVENITYAMAEILGLCDIHWREWGPYHNFSMHGNMPSGLRTIFRVTNWEQSIRGENLLVALTAPFYDVFGARTPISENTLPNELKCIKYSLAIFNLPSQRETGATLISGYPEINSCELTCIDPDRDEPFNITLIGGAINISETYETYPLDKVTAPTIRGTLVNLANLGTRS